MYKIVEEDCTNKTKTTLFEFESKDEAQKKFDSYVKKYKKTKNEIYDSYHCPFEFWCDTEDGEFYLTLTDC